MSAGTCDFSLWNRQDLNAHWFVTTAHVRRVIERWPIDCNTRRSDSLLADLTLAQDAKSDLSCSHSSGMRLHCGKSLTRAEGRAKYQPRTMTYPKTRVCIIQE